MITTSQLTSQLPKNAEILSQITQWDYSEIKNYILEKELLPEDRINGILKQYQLYLYLRIVEQFRAPMSCTDIDAVWHTHILHTENYLRFCNQINGGEYIHHMPKAHKQYCDNGCPDLLRMENLYQEHFGDSNFWGNDLTICW